MAIIDDINFLEKNYNKKSTYAEENPNVKLLFIETDDKSNVIREAYETGAQITFEYDTVGNLLTEACDANGDKTIEYYEKYKYEYWENGALKKCCFAKLTENIDEFNWQFIGEYDEEGNLIKVSNDYEGDGNIDLVEEYGKNNTKTKTIYDKNGKIINIQYYVYDSNGNIIDSKFDKDGDGTIEYQNQI